MPSSDGPDDDLRAPTPMERCVVGPTPGAAPREGGGGEATGAGAGAGVFVMEVPPPSLGRSTGVDCLGGATAAGLTGVDCSGCFAAQAAALVGGRVRGKQAA